MVLFTVVLFLQYIHIYITSFFESLNHLQISLCLDSRLLWYIFILWCWGQKVFCPQLMPTNCSAARQLTQFYKHSKSADLLRKSLLSHVWRVPSSKALSCKHERLFDLLTLASYSIIYLYNWKESGCKFHYALQFHERRVMPMNTMEVLTLLLVIFAALSYIDNHSKKK